MKKILVIYYSHTGITRKLAYKIQRYTGADIYEIKPIEPYPKDVCETIEIFKHELKNKSIRPIEKPNINLDKYDTIFIGTPNWGNTVATPFIDFFNLVDMHEKTIIPFVTHGGGGEGNCAKDILKLAGTKQKVTPLVVGMGGTTDEVIKKWIEKLNLSINDFER